MLSSVRQRVLGVVPSAHQASAVPAKRHPTHNVRSCCICCIGCAACGWYHSSSFPQPSPLQLGHGLYLPSCTLLPCCHAALPLPHCVAHIAGFPALGIQWQRMESDALRRAYGMSKGQKGERPSACTGCLGCPVLVIGNWRLCGACAQPEFSTSLCPGCGGCGPLPLVPSFKHATGLHQYALPALLCPSSSPVADGPGSSICVQSLVHSQRSTTQDGILRL